MAKYVKLCTNPQHSVKGPRGTECPACQAQRILETETWTDHARTEHTVLLQRIKDAFFEGFGSYATPAAAYNSEEEVWEESEAKKVYDTLKELWSIQ